MEAATWPPSNNTKFKLNGQTACWSWRLRYFQGPVHSRAGAIILHMCQEIVNQVIISLTQI